MMNGATSELSRYQRNIPINLESYKEAKEVARDNASGIMYASDHAHFVYFLLYYSLLHYFLIELAAKRVKIARSVHQHLVLGMKEDLTLVEKLQRS